MRQARKAGKSPREAGLRIEDVALEFLLAQGCRLVERNYRCGVGEIDLIVLHRRELAFVEVRYRKQSDFGDGLESVDQFKQRKIRLTAESWLQRNDDIPFEGCRFDVISVSGSLPYQTDWITDAF